MMLNRQLNVMDAGDVSRNNVEWIAVEQSKKPD